MIRTMTKTIKYIVSYMLDWSPASCRLMSGITRVSVSLMTIFNLCVAFAFQLYPFGFFQEEKALILNALKNKAN